MDGEINGSFIVDVSVLTTDLATLKKWFEGEDYNVKLFIPSYTIHELDYLKSGSSMISKNARESIRFIEKSFDSDHLKSSNEMLIETPEEVGPNWNKCAKYRIRSPTVGELEDVQQIRKNLESSYSKGSQLNEVLYEDDLDQGINSLERKVRNEANKKAALPLRLRYLIRPCVKKTHIDEEDWVLLTDDISTKTWCEAFGIKCLNIREAESKLFHSKNKDLNVNLQKERTGIQRPRSKQVVKKDDNNNEVIVQKYNTIKYAPRGKGELWVP